MGQKINMLVTGAEGFLGARLVNYYENLYEVAGVGHRDLDITDGEAVSAFFRQQRPAVAVHCAAVSDTGICQQKPDLSCEVNYKGTGNVARACRETGCRLVVMSSDQVYTGSCGLIPNREEKQTEPVNVYGRHKKEAEELALSLCPDALCLRLTWMYDLPPGGGKLNRNLPCNLIHALETGEALRVPVHEYRGITYVREAVEKLEAVLRLPGGVYNYGSENDKNTYETARNLLHLFAEDREEILIREEERFSQKPRNLLIDTVKLKRAGIRFLSTEEGFARCLGDYPEYVERLRQGWKKSHSR